MHEIKEIRDVLIKFRPFIIDHQHRERVYQYITLYKEIHDGETPTSGEINKFSSILISNKTCAIEADELLFDLSEELLKKFNTDYSKRKIQNLFKQAAVVVMIDIVCACYIGIFLVENGFQYFEKDLFLNGVIFFNAIIVFFMSIFYFTLNLIKD